MSLPVLRYNIINFRLSSARLYPPQLIFHIPYHSISHCITIGVSFIQVLQADAYFVEWEPKIRGTRYTDKWLSYPIEILQIKKNH